MLKIHKQLRLVIGVGILVKRHSFGAGELNLYIIFFGDGVIPRTGFFRGFKIGIFGLWFFRIDGQQQHIAHFVDAGSTQTGLRESHQKRILKLVATGVIPTKIAVIGARLHHTKRHRRPRECMSSPIGTDERIYPTRFVLRFKRLEVDWHQQNEPYRFLYQPHSLSKFCCKYCFICTLSCHWSAMGSLVKGAWGI